MSRARASVPRTGRLVALLVIVVALSSAPPGCQRAPTPTRLGGSTMGTSWSVVLTDALAPFEEEALSETLERELGRIDALMSTWNPDSELSAFNRGDGTRPMRLHADTLALIDAAREVGEASGGAYDITLGPLIDLWGFGADPVADDERPDEGAVRDALALRGPDVLVRGEGTLLKRRAGVRVDLSSIAKGYAVDRLGSLLEREGHVDHLVEIGGEVRTRGARADGSSWRVGIERADETAPDGLLLNAAHVASSGSYRNVRRIDGELVSHLIDGRDGRPVRHALVAVTVLHPDSTALADAWATALLVVGPEEARRLAREHALDAQLGSVNLSGELEIWRTAGFAARLATRDEEHES